MPADELIKKMEEVLGEYITVSGKNSGVVSAVSGRRFFLKRGSPSRAYACEANGLAEIAGTGTIAVPAVITYGGDHILTEYIEPGHTSGGFFSNFARHLADMHKVTSASFGFYEDNFIGANPQPNIPSGTEHTCWADFYFNKRLLFQFRLAERNGHVSPGMASGFAKLERNISLLLEGSEEPPSLLHGDLWSGNYICSGDGTPVVIDPAVYYGHREADLAMTMLFGGFPREFYGEYDKAYPLKPGWEERMGLYELYHVLNHLNIFGRSYLPHAVSLINRYANG